MGYSVTNIESTWNYTGLKKNSKTISWAGNKSNWFVQESEMKNWKWWRRSYEIRWKNNPPKSDAFKKANAPIGDHNSTALNNICREIYKKSNPDDNEKEDAWKYCSIPGHMPFKV
ncbi:hypothetical protein [Candidatus Mycoplasma haematohominis]|uniref:Uncharacterized protein n=1 Tax=Candidatus Mycoplasma haematohominis TaxID=1494318 RepID=A0A478FUV9_9MOLU|nr:hypothetical protein [Candidatus Mycoplasma haemohominis]GCE63905.1 hypothetical protein MHSWG343_09120 [Candidatus Mycoplasma haemohominis]